MALRSEFYPVDWKEISLLIREANQFTCQECGLACRRPEELYDSPLRTLTVSHYFHDYQSDAVFLACICTLCHLRHDAANGWASRRRVNRVRRRRAGQLEFFQEGKNAA